MKYLDMQSIQERKVTATLPIRGQTSTGYGMRLPSHMMLKIQGRWRRVYYTQYSNSGTAYVNINGEKHWIATGSL